MRSNPSDYEMTAPGNLRAIVSLLASEPGVWLPIAGGTDVMVQYAAGKLLARKLMSIWNLPELRKIEIVRNEICIGAVARTPICAGTKMSPGSCRCSRAPQAGLAESRTRIAG